MGLGVMGWEQLGMGLRRYEGGSSWEWDYVGMRVGSVGNGTRYEGVGAVGNGTRYEGGEG